MPTFEFTSPEGKTYTVEGPEGATKEQAFTKLQEQLGASQQKQSWGDVATQAIVNTPQSAVNFAKGIYQSVRHPIDTGENLLKAGAGAVRNLIPAEYQSQRPEAIKASQTADAIGQFYKQRYGSMEGVKNAIATDPVGVMADASAILSGGAAITPKASKLGQILSRAGEVTNPVKMATTAAGSVLNPTARALMNSALKPTIEQHRKGDAAVAVDTLLKYGISPTQKGTMKIYDLIDELNQKIGNKVAASNATISRDKVLSALNDVRSQFGTQVNPADDLAAIQKAGEGFMAHPYFQQVEAQRPALQEALQRAQLGKAQALQAAGKLKTFAAQQENLAHGGNVRLSPLQPENQLYFNAGATGKNVLSPSAYPTPLAPRFPGRYTTNMQRVPEGNAGYQDAMAAYAAKKAEELAAQRALDKWQATSGNIPVQLAQKLKQGTYKTLKGKYGEVGSASTEAQKGLARGLKENIAEVVPGIGALNAEESRLFKTLGVAERRSLMDMNKNPLGLAALAGNPTGFAAFMADRSAAFKALVARMMNRTGEAADFTGQHLATPALVSGVAGNAMQDVQR